MDLGRIGQGASPISQVFIAEGLAYAYDHPDGILSEESVHCLFESAASKFGSSELRNLIIRLAMFNWWQETDMRMSNRTRKWCKRWIPSRDS
jgi:hypothetical protein